MVQSVHFALCRCGCFLYIWHKPKVPAGILDYFLGCVTWMDGCQVKFVIWAIGTQNSSIGDNHGGACAR